MNDKKTTQPAWFFCAVYLRYIFISLIALSARAQIELPDAPADEPLPQEKMIEGDRQEIKELIEKMKRVDDRMNSLPVKRRDLSPKQISQQALYLDQHTTFVVKLSLRSGELVWGIIENQSLKVVNNVGSFPLILKEVKAGQSTEGETFSFKFSLKNGDEIKGKPSLAFLKLRLPSGGEREILFRDVQTMELMEAE